MSSVEVVLFVDEYDNPTGEISEKLAAHHDATKLHRAFSVYVFNEKGQFLVTKRAQTKKVWPGVWTNTCCGHPGPGESREAALKRRLDYELGMKVADVQMLIPDYIYKTPPYKGIIEHEYCPIFIARSVSESELNPQEVSAAKWVGWQWFKEQCENDPTDYSSPDAPTAPKWSWWCKDQLKRLRDHPLILEYANEA